MSTEATDTAAFQSPDRKQPPDCRMTWEEFQDWLEDGTHAEWVGGEVRIMAPASEPHQMMVSFFDTLLTLYVAKHDLGIILVAPFPVRLTRTSREPDVIYVSKANAGRINRTFVEGAPDLIIEILSPGTRHIDRGEKYYEYEEAGVLEYWMIDPDREQAEFHRLGANGRFQPILPESGAFESQALAGLRLEVGWLWNAPLAHIHSIARGAGAL